jgi:hypothetical protein
MNTVFAFKDLDIFKTHAAILAPPLFTAALLTDILKSDTVVPATDWLMEHPSLVLKIIGWSILLLSAASCVSIVLVIVDVLVIRANSWASVRLEESVVFLFLGTAFITAGLLILLVVFKQPPILVLNPFWHLGFIAYGLKLVEKY